ncbi:MAG: HdeD family acid-resistance protein [Terriglobales bacterium]
MSAKQFGSNPLAAGIEEIRSSWGWFLALGILFILLGAVCVIGNVSATFATVLVFGWMLLFSGIFALVHAFRTHSWQGFLLSLLSALFRGFTGYLLIRYPLAGAASLTLILASFFIVGGLFRAIGAGMLKFPRWGWSVFSGIVSLVLGIMLLAQMPVSSVWFIGFAIGVDLICDGASLIGLATAVHSLPDVALERAA